LAANKAQRDQRRLSGNVPDCDSPLPNSRKYWYTKRSSGRTEEFSMASKRNISQVTPQFGQSRSKAFNTTKRTFKPNIQTKRIFVPELGQTVRVRLTAKEIKTVDKVGLVAFLKRQGKTIKSIL
jgi:large subunit ribosomal protein L28